MLFTWKSVKLFVKIVFNFLCLSEPKENVKEILTYVIKQKSFSKAKKLGYLNVFVKLITKCGSSSLGYSLRDIFIW